MYFCGSCFSLKKELIQEHEIKYIVVYENNSDKFDIGHYQIKVKATAGIFFSIYHNKTVRSHNSTLVQAYIKHVYSSDTNKQNCKGNKN